MISTQILEVRFRPNARVLDRRGQWAETIAQEMELEHWNIVENRVDLLSGDKKIRAFVGFRNFGLTTLDAPTSNYFRDKATKLTGVISKLPDFIFPLSIERCGVRTTICHEIDAEVERIASVVRDRFVVPESLQDLGGADNVVDAAVALYFRAAHGQLNIRVSSNGANEIKAAFRSHSPDELPQQGWISDMDYFSSDKEQVSQKNLVWRIIEFSDELDRQHAALSAQLHF